MDVGVKYFVKGIVSDIIGIGVYVGLKWKFVFFLLVSKIRVVK